MRHGDTAGIPCEASEASDEAGIPGETETPREAKKSGDAGMPGGVTR